MTRNGFTRAARLAAAALVLSSASPGRACSPCSDAETSFAGHVLTDGIVALDWESDAEESGLLYVVKRYTTADRTDTPVTIAGVPAQGSCATLRQHGVQDSPDPGTYYYSLEVRTSSNGMLCSVPVNEGAGLTVEE